MALAGSYQDTWSKSGAIVAKEVGSKIIAQKINEKYWMYFGDTDLFMATSDDLIRWEPLIENGKLKSILRARRGYFDSRLVESGPYAGNLVWPIWPQEILFKPIHQPRGILRTSNEILYDGTIKHTAAGR
ncbi:MAG: hypothetical protein JSU09_08995 [Bacteroidetes bacterium]|nr:hypothetical protein [Bacteroidota bacterium]